MEEGAFLPHGTSAKTELTLDPSSFDPVHVSFMPPLHALCAPRRAGRPLESTLPTRWCAVMQWFNSSITP